MHLSKENEDLHHRLSVTRKDPISLKWIPPPRILRESAKLENNLYHGNLQSLQRLVGTYAIKTDNLIK